MFSRIPTPVFEDNLLLYSRITYRLENSALTHSDWFTIDSETGLISTRTKVYSLEEKYLIVIFQDVVFLLSNILLADWVAFLQLQLAEVVDMILVVYSNSNHCAFMHRSTIFLLTLHSFSFYFWCFLFTEFTPRCTHIHCRTNHLKTFGLKEFFMKKTSIYFSFQKNVISRIVESYCAITLWIGNVHNHI